VKIDYIYRCNLLNNIGGGGGKIELGLVGVKSRSEVRKREKVGLNQCLIYSTYMLPISSFLSEKLFAPLKLINKKNYPSVEKIIRGICHLYPFPPTPKLGL
jgi:hypothetical protein